MDEYGRKLNRYNIIYIINQERNDDENDNDDETRSHTISPIRIRRNHNDETIEGPSSTEKTNTLKQKPIVHFFRK